jgi:hypothetical protein
MAIAFPRICSIIGPGGSLATPAGELIKVAPAAHYAPPSGSFVIRTFPNVLLFYYTGYGITEVRIVRNSPFDIDFDPNDYLERYYLVDSNGRILMRCT